MFGRSFWTNLLFKSCQPLPGILDFGQNVIGVFLLEFNGTSHLFAIRHPWRVDGTGGKKRQTAQEGTNDKYNYAVPPPSTARTAPVT